ncbi:MAG TPA: hypothetical protein VKI40_00590 [Terriglobales bacterium]|nr:hypothetical protein [Terriglobales bacterium]
MNDLELRNLLCSLLEMMKRQEIHSQRLHGWIIAVAETLEKHPEIAAELKQHPGYDQGPLPWNQMLDSTIQHIDALILGLRVQ